MLGIQRCKQSAAWGQCAICSSQSVRCWLAWFERRDGGQSIMRMREGESSVCGGDCEKWTQMDAVCTAQLSSSSACSFVAFTVSGISVTPMRWPYLKSLQGDSSMGDSAFTTSRRSTSCQDFHLSATALRRYNGMSFGCRRVEVAQRSLITTAFSVIFQEA